MTRPRALAEAPLRAPAARGAEARGRRAREHAAGPVQVQYRVRSSYEPPPLSERAESEQSKGSRPIIHTHATHAPNAPPAPLF